MLGVLGAPTPAWDFANTPTKNIIIVGDTSVEIELAQTQAEEERGLMHRASLGANAGMLFAFPKVGIREFWNKNTFLPLDVIWIKGDTVVGISALPAFDAQSNNITIIRSPYPADHVLEVNAGWAKAHSVSVGTKIIY